MRDVMKNIGGFTDEQSRVIAATVETPSGPLRVVNGYFVNGQAPGSDKFAYKMKWLDALRDCCARNWPRTRTWCCWATSTSRPKTATASTPWA
jgi:exonuclease III